MDGDGAGSSACSTRRIRVGEYVVDPRTNTIDGAGGSHSVEPKVMDVLLELCARQGEVVPRETLIDAVWGAQHGADESLTRAVSLLRKALEAGPQGRRAIETFSKRGYRLNLAVSKIEAGAATVEAGAADNSERGGKGRWLSGGRVARPAVLMAGAALLGAVLVSAVLASGNLGAGAGAAQAGAVVERPGGGFVIEAWSARPGLAEVAGVGGRALASAFAQRGLSAVIVGDPAGGAAASGGEFRISGEVRNRGEQIVVGLQIVGQSDGAVLWAHEQTRSNSDAVSLVEGAAAHTANVAECALSARSQYVSRMPEGALPIWMRYCDGSWEDDYAEAFAAAERLAELSPGEAGPLAAVAQAAGGQADAMSGATNPEWLVRAEAASDRALAIDPSNLDALVTRAVLQPLGEWDATRTAFEALATGDRSALASNEAVFYFLQRSVGYLDDALTQAAFMTARSPGPTHLAEEAWLMATAGLTARALGQLDSAIRLYPDHYNSYWRRFNILALHGDLAQAEIALALSREGLLPGKKEKQSLCWEQYLLARLGRIAPEGALNDEVCLGEMNDFRARLHGALGQTDEALTYTQLALEDGRRNNSRGNTIHLFYPEMAEVRRDPRFWTLVDGVGLVDFWRGYGRWPDFCFNRRVEIDCPAMADGAVAARDG